MPIKSFRGKLADAGIDTISLHTNNGSTGYRIVKLQLIAADPSSVSHESIVQIFTVPQATASAAVDFNDQTLLAVGFYENNSGSTVSKVDIIFDNMTFNQDIYITHNEKAGSGEINYYIELEQIKLDLNENTVATLKDIRNIEAQSV